MAKNPASGKPPKPTRAEKKIARKAGRQKFFETWKSLGQAFNMTRKADSKFLPLFVITVVVAAAGAGLTQPPRMADE